MVPDIAKTGHSFKGALAYYLHDKRQEGDERQPETAERVAWTETRNLATDDPATAKRIMIATAQQADQLKEAAGLKATGRKSNAHVYAYSLAWHPDEAGKLNKAEMLRAVDQSLKALGAEKHQALIVCHRDQKHPHVHVIINRVDPATGKMLSTSNDRLKLSDWANQYERERGKILTPKREEKRQQREQFKDAAQRRDYAEERKQAAAQRPTGQKSAGAMLKEFQEQQKAQHRDQWKGLAQTNKAARDRIYAEYGQRMKDAAALHKTECKPIWAKHFQQARQIERQFQQRERSLSGVIVNAMKATTEQKISGQLGNRGVLAATFGNALSSQARAAALHSGLEQSRRELAGHLKNILDKEMAGLRDERAAALAKQRQAFDAARGQLIDRQNGERGKIREAWRQHYESRRDHHRKPYWKAQEKPAPQQEQKPMKREFEKARIAAPEPRRAPTTPEYVSRPAPSPSPAGEAPQPPARSVQQVPAQAAPTKPAKAAPLPKKDWSKSAAPAKPATPAPKDWSKPAQTSSSPAPAKDWSAKAPDRPREIKPLPVRDRSKDRDRSR